MAHCKADLYSIDLVLLTFGACHILAQSLFQPKKKEKKTYQLVRSQYLKCVLANI